MKCPFCGEAKSRVIDTREAGDGIRRRRRCQACQQRFTTYEQVASGMPMVVKGDDRREEFDRAKLLSGVRKACAKRPIASEDVEKLVDQVSSRVQSRYRTEVKSRIIGDLVMEGLKELDGVAYIRFASVYLPLGDLESMKREVDKLRVASGMPMVVKRDGRREEFDRAKLLSGVRKACAKRPIASEDVEGLVDQVSSRVQSRYRTEVKSRIIGDMVMEGLKEMDKVVYIRFASVHLPLGDLESMKREVDTLLEQE